MSFFRSGHSAKSMFSKQECSEAAIDNSPGHHLPLIQIVQYGCFALHEQSVR